MQIQMFVLQNITDASFVISKNSAIRGKQTGYWQKDA